MKLRVKFTAVREIEIYKEEQEKNSKEEIIENMRIGTLDDPFMFIDTTDVEVDCEVTEVKE